MSDSPVIFQPRDSGLIVAMLGMIEVGEIGSWMPGAFYWRLRLPDCAQQFRKVASLSSAQDQMREKVKDWLSAADVEPKATREGEIRAFRPDDWRKIKQAVRT